MREGSSHRRLVLALGIVCIAAVLVFLGARVSGKAPTFPLPSGNLAPSDCNIVFVLIDSLRADHLGCYGYRRNTSPFIDSLAAQGLLFEEAMSMSSFTGESVSAILSGNYPSCSPTGTGWFAIPNPDTVNLAEALQKAGYVTGLFTDSPVLFDPAFDKGFNENEHIEQKWGISHQGFRLSRRALEFLEKNRGAKTFTYLHYMDPHSPYEPTPERYLKFADKIFGSPLDLDKDVRPVVPELQASGFGSGDERFEDLVLRYDAEITETDDAVKLLLDGMKELGILEKTIVIVTADHGEEFLEHGYVEHGWQLYRESIHVPLIVWAPGLVKPARIKDCVSHIDMFPTLAAVASTEPRSDVQGKPLLRTQDQTLSYIPSDRPVISELFLETRASLRAIIADGHKYLAAQRWLTPEERSVAVKEQTARLDLLRKGELPLVDKWAPPVHEEYYDLGNDPGEQHPIPAGSAEQKIALKQMLDAHKMQCEKKVQEAAPHLPAQLPEDVMRKFDALKQDSPDKKPKPQTMELSPEQQEQMRTLGYL